MSEEELAAIEALTHSRCLTSEGFLCSCRLHNSAIDLLAEVRRLRAQVKIHGGDPDATLTIKNTIGHGEYVAIQFVEHS